ncbi:MAG: hypothetical protein LBV21_01930, partial [Candidatus Adiutrix sp.]|nr:hypothetical protein [Candidatus Adiutrix sp.]
MTSVTGADNSSAVAANPRRNGVRPLRATAGPKTRPDSETGSGVQRLSVAELKNGGTLNFGGLLEEGTPPAPDNLTRLGPSTPRRWAARQARVADMPLPERLEKLARIKKSATEYEAIFVDQLVKQMRPSPLADTPGGETFSEIAEQPFRDFLSRAGGLGLAGSIVGRIARQEGL